MTKLIIQDDLAERLRELARRENRQVEDVLSDLLELYDKSLDALEAMDGAFEDEVTDLSTTVRESMDEHYRKNLAVLLIPACC